MDLNKIGQEIKCFHETISCQGSIDKYIDEINVFLTNYLSSNKIDIVWACTSYQNVLDVNFISNMILSDKYPLYSKVVSEISSKKNNEVISGTHSSIISCLLDININPAYNSVVFCDSIFKNGSIEDIIRNVWTGNINAVESESIFIESCKHLFRSYYDIYTCKCNSELDKKDLYTYFIIPKNFISRTSKIAYLLCTANKLSDFDIHHLHLFIHSIAERDFVNRIEIESIKSAKAAIMSRNMSHNLGSHVMFYIKQKLQSVSKIIRDGVLADVFDSNGIIQTHCRDSTTKINYSAAELPFLVGLGRFINYLQERQDYIATVATDYIPARSTISFKDFIYDELKPDLRYDRHKKDNQTSGEEPKNLLLDYIAYSEKYEGSSSIEIKFGEFDGSKASVKKDADDFKKLRDFNVALPGGVIGRQAFFSIIENIIRNAAKHSIKASQLTLSFDVVEPNELDSINFLFQLPDGQKNRNEAKICKREIGNKEIELVEVKHLYKSVASDYTILRITSNLENNNDIGNIVNKLATAYVDDQGSMDDSAKGLKEMRISAAWMRGYSIDLDIPIDEEPPAIAVSEKREAGKNTYAIQYYICLPKPKRFAFVVSKETSEPSNIKEMGSKIFVDSKIFARDERTGKVSVKDEKAIAEIANYDVVIFCSAEYQNDLIPHISPRYICYKESNVDILGLFNERIAENDILSETISESVYSEWYAQRIVPFTDKACSGLSILDEKVTASETHNNSTSKGIYLESAANAVDITEEKDGVVVYPHYNNKVMFSTHYGGQACDNNELKGEHYKEACFVEAITGNNSSDRLIRQNEWDAEWKYKHLAAGLQRIAIFDERIFSYVMPAQYLIAEEKDLSAVADDLMKLGASDDFLYDKIESKLSFIPRPAVHRTIRDLLKKTDRSKDDIILELRDATNVRDIEKAQLFHEKRLWIYDIVCNSNGTVDFIGYNAPIENKVGGFDKSQRKVVTLATLSINGVDESGGNIYKINFTKGEIMKNRFNLISIHQGILDKIYEFFGVKENDAEKIKITDVMQRHFESYEDNCDFTKNFIIHSGRSKPNSKDMPQQVPFVQFAAIDHAVRDCKYTLSELLLTAHYEKE